MTGQPSILYYANAIFKDAGIESYAAVLTGGFKFIATMGPSPAEKTANRASAPI